MTMFICTVKYTVVLSKTVANMPCRLQRIAFEAFRDLVKLLRKGLKDSTGLAYVENEALDIRVKARSKASTDAGVKLGSSQAGIPTSHIPTVVAAAAAAADTAGQAETGVEDAEDGRDAAEDDMIDAAEDDAADLDRQGAECGIAHFTAQLQRAVVQEEEEELENSNFRKKYTALHLCLTCRQLCLSCLPVNLTSNLLCMMTCCAGSLA